MFKKYINFLFYVILLLLATMQLLQAQTANTYRIFADKHQASDYKTLSEALNKADIILFGELHDDSLCHAIEYQVLQDAHAFWGNKLVVGAEMLETDQQIVLNEYLNGLITEKNFKESLQLWKNYATDYAPLVNFAKTKKIPFIAANIPRRYASMVFRGGFEALDVLSPQAKRYIAPLPIRYDAQLRGYQAMLDMSNGMAHDGKPNLNFPRAQAIKDATMAHSILQHWQRGKCLLHFNGSYHSNNREGIVWYLLQAKPKLKILTIGTVQQSQIETLEEENQNIADFILAIQVEEQKTEEK